MFVTICRDYASLPTPERLTLPQIRFFYNAIRAELKSLSKKGK